MESKPGGEPLAAAQTSGQGPRIPVQACIGIIPAPLPVLRELRVDLPTTGPPPGLQSRELSWRQAWLI